MPFGEDELVKLAGIHDKSKSGKVSYEEFLSEQKYINQVQPLCSQWWACCKYCNRDIDIDI